MKVVELNLIQAKMVAYLKKGEHYKFVIETNNVILTYVAVAKSFDSMFVTFKDDRTAKIFTFNLNKVVSIEKIPLNKNWGEHDRNSDTVKKR
jgi:hypothetical protein